MEASTSRVWCLEVPLSRMDASRLVSLFISNIVLLQRDFAWDFITAQIICI